MLANRGAGAALLFIIGLVFRRVDNEPTIRQLYPILKAPDWPHRGLCAHLPLPGVEAAGTVLQSERFAAGTRVWLRGAGLGTIEDGTWRETISARDAALGLLPDAIPMPLGAAFFSPCTAAWVALFEVGALQAGERLLVSGASGAVGSVAVQLARAAGAQVGLPGQDEGEDGHGRACHGCSIASLRMNRC